MHVDVCMFILVYVACTNVYIIYVTHAELKFKCIQTPIDKYVAIHMHMHIHMHIYIHMYVHAHIHIRMHSQICSVCVRIYHTSKHAACQHDRSLTTATQCILNNSVLNQGRTCSDDILKPQKFDNDPLAAPALPLNMKKK